VLLGVKLRTYGATSSVPPSYDIHRQPHLTVSLPSIQLKFGPKGALSIKLTHAVKLIKSFQFPTHTEINTCLKQVNLLPVNFKFCTIDASDEIINSNLTGPCKRLCVQCFLMLERIRKLQQWCNLLKKVWNISLWTEKGCESYTTLCKKYENGITSGSKVLCWRILPTSRFDASTVGEH